MIVRNTGKADEPGHLIEQATRQTERTHTYLPFE